MCLPASELARGYWLGFDHLFTSQVMLIQESFVDCQINDVP